MPNVTHYLSIRSHKAAVVAGLLGAWPATGTQWTLLMQESQVTAEEAAEQYIANVRRLLETRIVPALKHGILSTALSRPDSLTVEVTDDPSPYPIGARIKADGSLTVRLSVGYLTMHDAALDAAALSDVLQRPADLRRYFTYQLCLAHENELRRAQGVPAQQARTFAEFISLELKEARAIFAQRDWRAARNAVEAGSLGWVLAHLLVRVDPRLAGMTSSQVAREGSGAARLAAASGWFPVPPVATAMGISEIERSAKPRFEERPLLCRTAQLMAAGAIALQGSAAWRARLQSDVRLKSRVEQIQTQIERMRRDSQCARGDIVTARVFEEIFPGASEIA